MCHHDLQVFENRFYSLCEAYIDSPVWYDLLKVKETYLHGRLVTIKNGECTGFSLDSSWIYEKSLETLFPDLYELCENKEVSVAQ